VREAFLEVREKAAPEVAEDKKEMEPEEENGFRVGEKMPKARQIAFEEGIEL